MFRVFFLLSIAVGLFSCQPRYTSDGGTMEQDAGTEEVDAGRLQGDDPPIGFKVAVPLPADAGASTRFVSVAAMPDQFGQPMMAFVVEDPNGDLNWDDNRVVFTRWNGTDKAYQAPRTIETIGGGAFEHPNRQVSIARDPDSGRIGVAYVKPQDNAVRFAFSDDEGLNWSLLTVSDTPRAALMSNPVLAMKGGTTHLAWLQGSDVVYRKRVGSSGSFVDLSPSGVTSGWRSLAMALDAAGEPALAFFTVSNTVSADLVFMRVGGTASVVASADMLDLSLPERAPSVSMAFSGTTPHLAYHLRKSADAAATELWYLESNDTGTTWAAPVAIPRNATATDSHSTRFYQALVIETSGRVSIAAPWSAIGTQTNCVGPKLARSTDGTSFTTCSPSGSPIQRGGDWMNLWQYKAGKLSMVFSYDSRANPSLGAGVIAWREL